MADGFQLQLRTESETTEVFTRYLIAADGMSSKVRKKLRPDDYLQKTPGGAMNYYCTGDGDLDPNGLYMVNMKAYAPIMFAWIYKKDDLWVIGTGAEDDLHGYADRFYEYVCRRYSFRGQIERKEAFASALKNGIYLGEGNTLICGDAAGLLDAYRGVAMDNAALSARFAVKAILNAEKTGSTAISHYTRYMQPMMRQLDSNEMKRQAKFTSDETLAESMAPGRMLVDGVRMMAANVANRFLPPEKVFTFPF